MSTRARLLTLSLLATSCDREDCKCADDSYGLPSLPTADATGVPTNTRIWGDSARRLFDDDGVEVPTSLTTVTDIEGIGSFTVLRPVRDLAPDSAYTVDAGHASYTFTTGPGPVATPPPIPVVADLDIARYRNCGHSNYRATYVLQGTSTVYLLDAGAESSFDPDVLVGTVTGFSPDPHFELGPRCGGGDNFPGGASRHASTTVRFAALDLAGNFSGWSEPEELTLTGCNLAGAPSLLSWCLAPLLLARRRRAHKRQAPVDRGPCVP